MKEVLKSKLYASDEEVKTAMMMKHKKENFTKQRYMLSFEGGTLLLRERGTMWRSRDVILRKNRFILMYDTCSCVGNYSFTKEKYITFWLILVLPDLKE